MTGKLICGTAPGDSFSRHESHMNTLVSVSCKLQTAAGTKPCGQFPDFLGAISSFRVKKDPLLLYEQIRNLKKGTFFIQFPFYFEDLLLFFFSKWHLNILYNKGRKRCSLSMRKPHAAFLIAHFIYVSSRNILIYLDTKGLNSLCAELWIFLLIGF